MHRKYSNDLLKEIFNAMKRNEDTKIYFDKENHDILQESQGYLTSLLEKNQKQQRQRLANRIMNREPTDDIVQGKHYLIPRLALADFISEFRCNIDQGSKLHSFFDQFEEDIVNDFGMGMIQDVNNVAFSFQVSDFFFMKLQEWQSTHNVSQSEIANPLGNTVAKISLNFLEELE
jgi:hypothetical protein